MRFPLNSGVSGADRLSLEFFLMTGRAGPVNWAEAVTALASTITAAAVIFAAIQVAFHNRQMHRDFESLYLQRYWTITDQRSRDFLVSGSHSAEDEKVIHNYLDLSNDQVSLRALGRITDDTWRFWEEAIYEFIYSQPYYDYALEDAGLRYQHLWNMLEHHDHGVHDPDDYYDPLTWHLVRRKLNGL